MSLQSPTSAAGGFHGCQLPSSDLISLCSTLSCCTRESRCCQVLCSTSAQFLPNPHNTGFLVIINRGIVLVVNSVSSRNTDKNLWAVVRNGWNAQILSNVLRLQSTRCFGGAVVFLGNHATCWQLGVTGKCII